MRSTAAAPAATEPGHARPRNRSGSGAFFLTEGGACHKIGRNFVRNKGVWVRDRVKTHFQDLSHGRRRVSSPGRHQSDHPGRGHLRHRGHERRGQVHPGALHQPAGAPYSGPGGHRRTGSHGAVRPPAAGEAPLHQHDLPAVQPAHAAHLPGQHLLPHGDRRGAQGGGAQARPGVSGHRGPARQGQRLPGPALRRPEAAHRHRPRPGLQSQGAAVRRGHLRPGPHHHPQHPQADPGHQPAHGHHRRDHYPRDGGGGGDLLPRGHPGARPHGGDRHSGGGVLQPSDRGRPPAGVPGSA